MKKYEVTIQFMWQAKNRHDTWREVEEYIDSKMRGLATVTGVSINPAEDPEEWMALNEPIQGKRGTD